MQLRQGPVDSDAVIKVGLVSNVCDVLSLTDCGADQGKHLSVDAAGYKPSGKATMSKLADQGRECDNGHTNCIKRAARCAHVT